MYEKFQGVLTMRGFLSIDSKFFKYLSFLGDLVILTILWTFCSIPLITLGAATTGMYYVLTRRLSDREGYISKDFFKSFKQNFVQATILTLIVMFMAWMIYFNISNLQTSSPFWPIQFVLCYELIITIIYIFPILSRFSMSVPQILKTALFMANRHLFTTFTCVILFIALVAICRYNMMLITVCAGFYGWLTSMMFMKLFRKYLPMMDVDMDHTNAEVGEMLERQAELERLKAEGKLPEGEEPEPFVPQTKTDDTDDFIPPEDPFLL